MTTWTISRSDHKDGPFVVTRTIKGRTVVLGFHSDPHGILVSMCDRDLMKPGDFVYEPWGISFFHIPPGEIPQA